MSAKLMHEAVAAFANKEIGVGATAEEIKKANKALGVELRGSYLEFLRTYGWGRFAYDYVLGLGEKSDPAYNVVSTTMWERNESEPSMPKSLIPVRPDGAGNHYCLDFSVSDTGEPPVVFWDHEIGDFEEHSKSFSIWLVTWLDDLRTRKPIQIDLDE